MIQLEDGSSAYVQHIAVPKAGLYYLPLNKLVDSREVLWLL